MKKLLSIILSVVMVVSLGVVLGACGEEASSAPEAVIPEGYKAYNNKEISFAYPNDWVVKDGSTVVISNKEGIGNNITVAYETQSDVYKTMDRASFDSLLGPAFQSMGMTISNVSIEQKKNGCESEISVISFNNLYMNTSMKQTMYCVNAANKTYLVTVTETKADEALLKAVFDTLRVEK